MKAHMQEENEQLILNDVGATNVTNDDYDQIVQLPVNNQPRFVRGIEDEMRGFCSAVVNRKRRRRNNDEIIKTMLRLMKKKRKQQQQHQWKQKKFYLNQHLQPKTKRRANRPPLKRFE